MFLSVARTPVVHLEDSRRDDDEIARHRTFRVVQHPGRLAEHLQRRPRPRLVHVHVQLRPRLRRRGAGFSERRQPCRRRQLCRRRPQRSGRVSPPAQSQLAKVRQQLRPRSSAGVGQRPHRDDLRSRQRVQESYRRFEHRRRGEWIVRGHRERHGGHSRVLRHVCDRRARVPARRAEGRDEGGVVVVGGGGGRVVGCVGCVGRVDVPAERERDLRAAPRPGRHAEQGGVPTVARGGRGCRDEQALVLVRGRGRESLERRPDRPLVRVEVVFVSDGARRRVRRPVRARHTGGERDGQKEGQEEAEEEVAAPSGAERGRYRDHAGAFDRGARGGDEGNGRAKRATSEDGGAHRNPPSDSAPEVPKWISRRWCYTHTPIGNEIGK